MKQKQTKIINSYYCIKYLVSTKKVEGKGYETMVFRVNDYPYRAKYEVDYDKPVFEAHDKTWLGAMITHAAQKNYYKSIADKF